MGWRLFRWEHANAARESDVPRACKSGDFPLLNLSPEELRQLFPEEEKLVPEVDDKLILTDKQWHTLGRPGVGYREPGRGNSRYISNDIRAEVIRRDGGRCVLCGAESDLHIDHIIPFSIGGSTHVDNLQVLCKPCNLSKSNKI